MCSVVRGYQELAIEDDDSGFRAYLVVESSDSPISFGGTRVDASVTRSMVRDLADNMALKLALHGSPVGGAKAGLRVSPDDPRLTQYLHRFAETCQELLSSTTILGKDMGAKQWMLDEIYKSLNMPQLGIVHRRGAPGCPDRLGDLSGYIANMTGKGVFWSIEQALGGSLSGAQALIQGFGVVGSGVAWHLSRRGVRILGVSDRNKAIIDPAGLEPDALMEARGDDGLVDIDRLPRRVVLDNPDDLLEQRADVLVLAAGSYLVHSDLASRIRAPVVVEGANLALLPDARQVLHRNGVRVVPDVVANSASAALVGHQIASGNRLSPALIWGYIEDNIRRTTDSVERLSNELDIDSKTAFRRVIESAAGSLPGRQLNGVRVG
jgi:glutamate dehydrogenase (NAD(P)+)